MESRRITTELELRTIERYRQASVEYKKAKKLNKIAFKSLVDRSFNLIPKGAREIIESKRLNRRKYLPLPPSLPSGGACLKELNKGMYMTERQKNHRIYLIMQ